jgi:hypothetical protein
LISLINLKSSLWRRFSLTGKAAYTGGVQEEGEDMEADSDIMEAQRTIAAA